MNSLRKIAGNRYINMPFCLYLVFFLAKCTNPSEPINTAKYSGEVLIRGIFFADGPVAYEIPEIEKNFTLDKFILDDYDIQLLRAIQSEIIQTLEEKKPELIENFQHVVYSDNHIHISEYIDEISLIIYEIASNHEQVRLYSFIMQNESIKKQITNKLSSVEHTNLVEGLNELAKDEELMSLIENELNNSSGEFDISGRQQCFIGPVVAVAAFVVGAVAVILYGGVAVAAGCEIGLWGCDLDSYSTGGGGPVPLPSSNRNTNASSLWKEKLVNSIVQL